MAHFMDVVIPCESNWHVDSVSAGGHLGLAQFAPDSWAKAASRTGLWDWRDPYAQGANVAVWVSLTVPAEQWSCY